MIATGTAELLSRSAADSADQQGTMESLFWLPRGDLVPMDWNTQQLSPPRRSCGSVRMISRSMRLAGLPVFALMGVLLVSGCAGKRSSTRISHSKGRVFQNVTPRQEYNPEADPIPMTPPAPGDSDPPPPTRSTSDYPPSPPKDDFESAERPGRHSASFGPYTGRVTPASKSSDQPDASL